MGQERAFVRLIRIAASPHLCHSPLFDSILFKIANQARQENLPMPDHFWFSRAQLERIKPYFPLSLGAPRAGSRRVIRNELPWYGDAPAQDGPHITPYKTRHKIWNLFAKLKDWHHIATEFGYGF
jgi:hypothetical protein